MLLAVPWPLRSKTDRNGSNNMVKINGNADIEQLLCVLTFSFVLASLSQKLNFPSEPTVARVPCVGWKAMSFTYKDVYKISIRFLVWAILDLMAQ